MKGLPEDIVVQRTDDYVRYIFARTPRERLEWWAAAITGGTLVYAIILIVSLITGSSGSTFNTIVALIAALPMFLLTCFWFVVLPLWHPQLSIEIGPRGIVRRRSGRGWIQRTFARYDKIRHLSVDPRYRPFVDIDTTELTKAERLDAADDCALWLVHRGLFGVKRTALAADRSQIINALVRSISDECSHYGQTIRIKREPNPWFDADDQRVRSTIEQQPSGSKAEVNATSDCLMIRIPTGRRYRHGLQHMTTALTIFATLIVLILAIVHEFAWPWSVGLASAAALVVLAICLGYRKKPSACVELTTDSLQLQESVSFGRHRRRSFDANAITDIQVNRAKNWLTDDEFWTVRFYTGNRRYSFLASTERTELRWIAGVLIEAIGLEFTE